MNVTEEKAALRGDMRRVRRDMGGTQRARASKALVQRLVSLPAMRDARTVGVYLACGSELSLAPAATALRAEHPHVTIAYPVLTGPEDMVFLRCTADEVRALPDHPTDIVSDIDTERIVKTRELDIVLVPGLAFDANGRRLGQGGGFYDRVLPHMRRGATSVGIAFDEQIVDEVPTDGHDRTVDYVLTPTRLITARH